MLKKNFIYGRIIFGTLLSIIFAYIIYQVFSAFKTSIRTVRVGMETAGEYIIGRALFVRDEIPLPDIQNDIYTLTRQNGEKIASGDCYAIEFRSAAYKKQYEEKQENRKLLNQLRSVSVLIDEEYALTSLNKDIISHITSITAEGYVSPDVVSYSDEINALFLKRFYSIHPEEITETLSYYEMLVNTDTSTDTGSMLNSPVSGYYFSYADGYEDMLSLERIKTLSPSTVKTLIEEHQDRSTTFSRCPGKIITNYSWQFLLPLDAKTADRFTENKRYQVKVFGCSINATLLEKSSEENGVSILRFSSDADIGTFARLRFSDVTIVLEEYTGYSIPLDALRLINGKTGVFCLHGYVADFVEVTILWKSDSYYIAQANPDSKKSLYSNDYIIINTKGIVDGMIITENPSDFLQ